MPHQLHLKYAKKNNAMMDAKLNSADVNGKVEDGSVDKRLLRDSKTTDLQEHVQADCVTAENPVESNLQNNPNGGVSREVSTRSPSSVEKAQPKPLCALLPPSVMETRTVYEVNKTIPSMRRSQGSLKTTSVHTEPDEEDLCAAILLACLFCHPLDCLLATVGGCSECVWSLCSYLCGCEPATLQPLLDVTHHCDLCRCLGARCFLCDCPICDICLQATECLDLAMEISQMLFH
ncbi:myoD family inhibitor domain-containing protein 2 isoform X2 [Scophthalmus maximus]|uniref:myoD family inhibitor domain-containing protein 2 isoform X2 n=1 Tax=Scophthalmus maximus TaxID=52904 RepID=UPI0015E0C78D|nr:myoD family inhibitor domain-containing protein 2 isoform X2 [Scophthalmus maximus]